MTHKVNLHKICKVWIENQTFTAKPQPFVSHFHHPPPCVIVTNIDSLTFSFKLKNDLFVLYFFFHTFRRQRCFLRQIVTTGVFRSLYEQETGRPGRFWKQAFMVTLSSVDKTILIIWIFSLESSWVMAVAQQAMLVSWWLTEVTSHQSTWNKMQWSAGSGEVYSGECLLPVQ